jgi:glycosyltransferase involved in cell wall biosynthesis
LGGIELGLMRLPISPPGKTGWPWTNNEAFEPSSSQNYPKISIVTPTFRHGHYLEETIRSVLAQGYPNLEYVVIDGGSKDETIEILKKYSNHIHYWVSEPDRGHAHALNKGFAQTTGEILAWINAGDFYFPQALHRVAQVFQELSEVVWLTSAQPLITCQVFLGLSLWQVVT